MVEVERLVSWVESPRKVGGHLRTLFILLLPSSSIPVVNCVTILMNIDSSCLNHDLQPCRPRSLHPHPMARLTHIGETCPSIHVCFKKKSRKRPSQVAILGASVNPTPSQSHRPAAESHVRQPSLGLDEAPSQVSVNRRSRAGVHCPIIKLIDVISERFQWPPRGAETWLLVI
ncbi:hypothetical protein B0T10DRAFT_147870 [Thelonectria olida]|uniref:Uncharacterized protein n=1 Tax=Thelonectria olida TaxID=1576542 RepID=A0A9P8VYF8_9HYPO|nr:hypothetical protein B0T10DRAFT_147870 [Thelonectria olida]